MNATVPPQAIGGGGDQPEPEAPPVERLVGDYAKTGFADMRSQIDPVRFADAAYTATPRKMILRVVAAEAPVRDDLLVERIASSGPCGRSETA